MNPVHTPTTPAEAAAPDADVDSGFQPHRPGRTPPAPDAATLLQRLAALRPAIAAGAARRERERALPFAWLRRLAEAGLYTLRIPRAHGGPGGTLRDLARLVSDLAAADPNIAQAMRPGFGFLESVLASGDEALARRWFPRALDGQIFGNAGWERGGPNGQITARLLPDGTGWRVSGTKFYSTGALYADWVGSFALDPQGQERGFIVPRDRPGLQLLDDFDAIGQRLTASGTTVFEGVRVEPDELRPAMARDRRSPVAPLYQLYLAALLAGIARNACDDAVDFARRHARPIRHSSAQRSVDDPYVQETVGEIATQAFAADAAVQQAAGVVDAAWAADLDADALTEASIAVAQAQVFAAQAALRAGERLFDVASGSATLRTHNLDRHWRNARTIANHNPRQWKAAAVGHWLLDGTPPPTSGLL